VRFGWYVRDVKDYAVGEGEFADVNDCVVREGEVG
jgi:hypothetical protein